MCFILHLCTFFFFKSTVYTGSMKDLNIYLPVWSYFTEKKTEAKKIDSPNMKSNNLSYPTIASH